MLQAWQKCNREHPLTPGGRGDNRGPWGCQNQISSNQKVSLTKVVRYVSRETKIHSGSPSDSWGHSGGGGVPRGCQNQISSSQKVSLTKVVRYVSGVTKNHPGSPSDPWGSRRTWGGPWGGQKISSNQKISLTKVVGYVSGVTKTSQAPARLGPKQLCVST